MKLNRKAVAQLEIVPVLGQLIKMMRKFKRSIDLIGGILNKFVQLTLSIIII